MWGWGGRSLWPIRASRSWEVALTTADISFSPWLFSTVGSLLHLHQGWGSLVGKFLDISSVLWQSLIPCKSLMSTLLAIYCCKLLSIGPKQWSKEQRWSLIHILFPVFSLTCSRHSIIVKEEKEWMRKKKNVMSLALLHVWHCASLLPPCPCSFPFYYHLAFF